MGWDLSKEQIADMVRRGATIGKSFAESMADKGLSAETGQPIATVTKVKKDKAELVRGGFQPPGIWMIPLRVYSGDNASGFRHRIGRAGHERRACYREFAKAHGAWAIFYLHLMSGGRLRITTTRLGGRGMDRHAVSSAMKYVVDSVADFCGLDDADLRFVWEDGQEPGGPYGVRVTIERI